MIKEDELTNKGGRRENQKLKPLIILDYLKKESDKDHLITRDEIVDYLGEEGREIDAEVHSIGRDIRALNIALLMTEEGCSTEEAKAIAEENEDVPIKVVDRRGYYYNYDKYDLTNLQILADCVYASPFLSSSKANELVDIVCDLMKNTDAEKLRKRNEIIGRVRTTNKEVLYNISKINEALNTEDYDGNPKEPQKISFKQVAYKINDLKQQADKYENKRSIVSPFGIFINDGNYYLLAYHDTNHNVYTYRIDRLRDVKIIDEPREGEEAIKKAGGIKAFAERKFTIQQAEKIRVNIEFRNFWLNTVRERLGTDNVRYYAVKNEDWFGVITEVELTKEFFSWLLLFGESARILTPDVKTKYLVLLEKVINSYSE